jgi:DNA-binding ferritin-like protein
MDTLQEIMKKVLADTFALYLKAHNYHWNVEGSNFPQYHEFFGNLYEELHGAVDPIAEEIRSLDTYAPGSFTRFMELTEIEDETSVPTGVEMARRLMTDNERVIATLNIAFKLADQFDKQGNFIKSYNFIREACYQFGTSIEKIESNIGACCRGRQKQAYGYVWKFKK